MALVTLNEILPIAKKNGYAIPAFNIVNLDMILPIIHAAEAQNSPVIIEYTENDGKRIPIDVIGKIASKLVKEASVPVVLHLDHGNTLKGVMAAIRSGFSSVMYDGSSLAFEENIANTVKVVEIAHAVNVSVEAELGHISTTEDIEATTEFTNPRQAKDFIEQTKVDALAITFGTKHGDYKGSPDLHYDVISEIAALTNVPLVMHGGSGLEEGVYRKVIAEGISKINYYSAMSAEFTELMRVHLNKQKKIGQTAYLQDCVSLSLDFFQAHMEDVMQLFGSAGKAGS